MLQETQTVTSPAVGFFIFYFLFFISICLAPKIRDDDRIFYRQVSKSCIAFFFTHIYNTYILYYVHFVDMCIYSCSGGTRAPETVFIVIIVIIVRVIILILFISLGDGATHEKKRTGRYNIMYTTTVVRVW